VLLEGIQTEEHTPNRDRERLRSRALLLGGGGLDVVWKRERDWGCGDLGVGGTEVGSFRSMNEIRSPSQEIFYIAKE